MSIKTIKSLYTFRLFFRVTRLFLFGGIIGVPAFTPISLMAQWTEFDPAELTPADFPLLSMDELLDLEITSVSKKKERLSEAAAAVFVVTQEDSRRSGATTIPEALRMVPGVHVARIDSSTWAVTSRGFNGFFANKLLVLIDGRSVYSPTFSGVNWDVQDTLLEDIERIEVIRGPGATLWGANAVNGVINIITKKTQDTQGGLLTGGSGTEERIFDGFRYGLQLEDNVYLRMYTKAFKRDDLVNTRGDNAHDDWDGILGGFRMDWEISENSNLALHGDIYDERAHETVSVHSLPPSLSMPFGEPVLGEKDLKGGNVLGRWNYSFSQFSDLALQLYYDRVDRKTELFEETYDTIDLDFQHRFHLMPSLEIIWGLGYRYITDHFDNSFSVSFDPRSRNTDLFSGFLQGSYTLFDEHVRLTMGSKFEHNDFTGFEVQPNVRLSIVPNERHTVWGAISRSIRTPSRTEHDGKVIQSVEPGNPFVPSLPPFVIASFQGEDDFDSEEVLAFELGYRIKPIEHLSLDLASFLNLYDNIRTVEIGTPASGATPIAPIVVPILVDNKMDGDGYGVEIAANWFVFDWWRITSAYTLIYVQLQPDSDSNDENSDGIGRTTPHQQYVIRSSMDLSRDIEFDMDFRYVDNLTARDVPKYTSVDIRLAWKPVNNLELSLVGQNLLDSSHLEFDPEFLKSLPTENERSFYGKVTLNF